MAETLVAVDMETAYGDDLNVKRQGPVNYALATQLIMVGIWSPTIEYVGPLETAPWGAIAGCHWLSHNAGFDQAVWQAAVQRGLTSAIPPAVWDCTADLSAFVGIGRSLADAVKNSFGVEISKSIRQRAGNRVWPDGFNPKMREDFKKYCLEDAKWCYKLWEKWHEFWLPEEREFALLLRKRNHAGIGVDCDVLAHYRTTLTAQLAEARANIPWSDPPLSRAQLVRWCEKQGVEPPGSVAEKSEVSKAWERQYGEKFPIIGQLRAFRKANRRLEICGQIERRIMANGRCNFTLKYHGAANTGRLSGSDGLNMQNLNRDAENGVDLRMIFRAAEGKIFVIADFAQIEPRVVAWICRDKRLLDLLGEGMNFYEVDARLANAWKGEPGTLKRSNKDLYQLQKAQSLGIGYGMGARRFVEAARSMLNLEFDEEQARGIIARWHARYPGVKPIWNRLEQGMNRALNLRDDSFGIQLPSGRWLRYYDLRRENGVMTAATVRGSTDRMRYWGATLFENCLTGNTEILTDHGWRELLSVQLSDKLWDGIEWVSYGGIVAKGFQSTVDLMGIRCTPDHFFLTSAGWQTANDILYGKTPTLGSETESACPMGGSEIRPFIGNRISGEQWEADLVESAMRLWKRSDHRTSRSKESEVLLKEMSFARDPLHSRDVFSSSLCGLAFHAGPLLQPELSCLQELWRTGDYGVPSMDEFSTILGGRRVDLHSWNGYRSPRQRRWGLLFGEHSVGYSESQRQQQTEKSLETLSGNATEFLRNREAERSQSNNGLLSSFSRNSLGNSFDGQARRYEEVFDILNAGPRHCFTVRGGEGCPAMIAHNCVQATARDVLRDAILRLEAAGHPVIFSSHDEVVIETEKIDPEVQKSEIIRIMTIPPTWAHDLPLAAEATVSTHYLK